ncbi:hypothetical protein KF707_16475 [Candidatus Obscuribacterales bacterium]|nr:hypothetical protein [Candidatus Obscuribacterales bacterium]
MTYTDEENTIAIEHKRTATPIGGEYETRRGLVQDTELSSAISAEFDDLPSKRRGFLFRNL